MKEQTVRKVMIKYFASKGIKIIHENIHAAGPDFHIEGEGKVVEVKGSRYNFDRMLRQLWKYAFKFVDVSLALPYDGLTLKRAEQLSGLASLIEEATDFRLKVYLVAPKSQTDNTFFVGEFKDVYFIRGHMGTPTAYSLGLIRENLDSTKDTAIENLVKYSPVDELRRQVCNLLPRYLSVIQI